MKERTLEGYRIDFGLVRSDKKMNAAYWDGIDNAIEDCIYKLARRSAAPLSIKTLEDAEITAEVADVREKLIGWLESIGGEYPYVETPM